MRYRCSLFRLRRRCRGSLFLGLSAMRQQLCNLAAEQHRESAQVDDDAGNQIGDLRGEILRRQIGAADGDVRNKQRRENGADGV